MPEFSQCHFCGIPDERIIDETEACLVILDLYPVTPLHTLVITKRHVASYFDLNDQERREVQQLIDVHSQRINNEDETVSGFNIGINCGEDAGQTVMHCHVHLIPRRRGDTENPRGGVRGVIPSKQNYLMSDTTLIKPIDLYSRSAVLAKPCPVPEEPGVYAWFFKEVPAIVPTDDCVTKDGLKLLYVGISPDKVGKPNGKQNLRKRITNHYRGNAEGSTLRRSLGVLLTNQSDFPLRRVGSGKQMTFTHLGEHWLDDWMEENAFVNWIKHPEPWKLEEQLLGTLSLPINIKGNKDHLFASTLNQLRKDAIRSARELSVANEGNQQRRR